MLRLATFLGALLLAAAATADERPNIVFILADDLGRGDIGPYGQKLIRTPNLDRLATQGMCFTRHYCGNAVCAPSRCVLMTGKHPGHAFIRDNRETKPEGQWPIPAETFTLAKLLRAQGYATGAFGKWGLGGPDSSGAPLRQGFDHFYGYNCQRHAHNFYPTYLWNDTQRVALDNPEFASKQMLLAGADPHDPQSYARYRGNQYSADLIAEQARAFVRAHRERPFFLYWPTTVPHVALQVPEDSLAEYRDQFDDVPYDGSRGYLPHQYPRAAYAAMITRMDTEIGRLLELLDELELSRRTLIVFTSDNGALPSTMPLADTTYFRSTNGLRGGKGSLYEGGILAPLIVRWPGTVPPGSETDRLSGFEDWLPTLAEAIGAKEAVPADVDGISLLATLRGQAQPPREFLYREFPGYGGWQSVHMGQWKALREKLNPRGKNAQPDLAIQLYNLRADPAETTNVAAEHADVVARLEQIMRAEHVRSPEFPLVGLDGAP